MNCFEIVEELEYHGEQLEESNITLWERQGKLANIGVVGLRSRYTIDLFQQDKSVHRALQILAASTAIMEVQGRGWYEDEVTGERMTGIEGLMSETGKLVGTYLLLILVLSFGAILFLLKVRLDPLSLGELAMLYSHRTKKSQRTKCGRKRRNEGNHLKDWSEIRKGVEKRSLGIYSLDLFHERENDEDGEYLK